MSYILQSDHPEALQDGRVVEPGIRISEADAKKNSRLIERGVLVKESERPTPRKKKSDADEAGQESAAAPQEKEESK